MAWTIEFYEEGEGGRAPVEEFIKGLPKRHKAKALSIIKLLEEKGVDLGFPHSSQVRGRIRELRTQLGKDKLRILYFADSRRWFILLHGLIKRTGELEERDIQAAVNRMNIHNAWLERQQGD